MKSKSWRSVFVLGITLAAITAEAPASGSLPVIDGEEVVAKVNGVPITLDEFAEALSQTHMGMNSGDSQAAKLDPFKLLDRLIAAELVTQEAENIGLAELPNVADAIDAYHTQALRSVLFARYARTITTPDATRVTELYRLNTGEVKLESIVFKNREDALAVNARLVAGESFDQLASEVDPEQDAIQYEQYDFVKPDDLLPGIREALSLIQPGQVSSAVAAGSKFAIVKFVDVRYPEDAAAREEAERVVLRLQRQNALRKYSDELTEKYTTIDEELLKSLDYSTEGPGLDTLRADERIVATARGGAEPVTVAELTAVLAKNAYHGPERAMEQGKFDVRKHKALTDLCKKRALDAEIRAQKIEESSEYLTMMEEYRKGVLFGVFMERVIDPSIKLDQQQVKKFLDEHVDEYSTPEMIRLDSLAFVDETSAKEAAEKLRNGVDFIWLRRNAEGQVPPDSSPEPLQFDGRRPVVVLALPDALRPAVEGSATGDITVFSDPGTHTYVIVVRDVIPSKPQEFDAIKDAVAQRVQRERRQESLDEWVGELRAASEIETFVTGDTLLEALGMTSAAKN